VGVCELAADRDGREFLAVGAMVTLSIYLRQQGSSQSNPVGASHAATAEEST
jgi:hypothetical protein